MSPIYIVKHNRFYRAGQPRPVRARSGFGLLEVLLSTAIFIVVVGSLVSLSRLSIRNAALSSHRAQALNLAQDALETARQMRDTTWVDPLNRAPSGAIYDDWRTYPACSGGYTTITLGTAYEICYLSSTKQFGLRPTPTDSSKYASDKCSTTENSYTPVDDNFFIKLYDANGQIDPGAPLCYRRTLTYEPVATTNTTVDANNNPLYFGLQFLDKNSQGLPQIPNNVGVEPVHTMRVRSKVEWTDFDKDWSIELTTLLTNWRIQ